ncbi:MAG: hypothetical protein PHT48_07660 [Dechloromonas sp.]|nr:hypothetical protein [Dechloromonas sp.]
MQALLSFDQSPPLAAPLRFFLTAPWFAVLAGVLLWSEGATVFASRWMPSALAATHLLTLGFMLMTMLGALIQIFPVVAGANMAHPLRLARVVHGATSVGSLCLALAFLYSLPWLFALAGGLLLLAIAYFLGAAGLALRGQGLANPTIRGLKLALFGLWVTLLLGLGLVGALAGGWRLPWAGLTDLHAAWGLAGWSGTLLVAMAYVVVPMFQLTPGYPARESQLLSPVLLLCLLLWSVALLFSAEQVVRLAEAGLALLGLLFAGRTLYLQAHRRRPRRDALAAYWQSGMLAAILACGMLLTAAIAPALAQQRAWPLVFAVLLVAGAFMSFINGMLYKIIPFLGWLHLQNAGRGTAPPMAKLMPEAPALRQWWLHQLALLTLLLAALWPESFARLAGFCWVLANAALGWNLWQAARRYRQYRPAPMASGQGGGVA